MFSNIAATIFTLGTLVSMNVYASSEINEDKKRRTGSQSAQSSFEPIADIHSSPVITAHPTRWVSSTESVSKLEKLRIDGEARERQLRAWYESKGRAFPERFAGD